MKQSLRLSAEWQQGFRFFCRDSQGHLTVLDADPEREGMVTEGPAPVEAFLESLAVCGAIDVLFILKKRRLKVSKFNVEIEAERRDALPKIFTRIEIKYIISGRGITEREIARAVEMSEQKLCSILAMIDQRQTEVVIDFHIV